MEHIIMYGRPSPAPARPRSAAPKQRGMLHSWDETPTVRGALQTLDVHNQLLCHLLYTVTVPAPAPSPRSAPPPQPPLLVPPASRPTARQARQPVLFASASPQWTRPLFWDETCAGCTAVPPTSSSVPISPREPTPRPFSAEIGSMAASPRRRPATVAAASPRRRPSTASVASSRPATAAAAAPSPRHRPGESVSVLLDSGVLPSSAAASPRRPSTAAAAATVDFATLRRARLATERAASAPTANIVGPLDLDACSLSQGEGQGEDEGEGKERGEEQGAGEGLESAAAAQMEMATQMREQAKRAEAEFKAQAAKLKAAVREATATDDTPAGGGLKRASSTWRNKGFDGLRKSAAAAAGASAAGGKAAAPFGGFGELWAAASAMEAMKTAMLMASSTAGGKGGKGGKASHQSLSQAVEAALVVEEERLELEVLIPPLLLALPPISPHGDRPSPPTHPHSCGACCLLCRRTTSRHARRCFLSSRSSAAPSTTISRRRGAARHPRPPRPSCRKAAGGGASASPTPRRSSRLSRRRLGWSPSRPRPASRPRSCDA